MAFLPMIVIVFGDGFLAFMDSVFQGFNFSGLIYGVTFSCPTCIFYIIFATISVRQNNHYELIQKLSLLSSTLQFIMASWSNYGQSLRTDSFIHYLTRIESFFIKLFRT